MSEQVGCWTSRGYHSLLDALFEVLFFFPSYLSVIGGHPELLPPPPLMLLSGDWAR